MTSRAKQLQLFADAPPFQGRSTKSVTFKGNLDCPIHRWFRLTPSFSPDLVADILEHWNVQNTARILDPFCGVGTTPLLCQEKGLRSSAVELNPLLHFVAKVKTTPVKNPRDLALAAEEVVAAARRRFATVAELQAEAFLVRYREYVPNIQSVTKWWSVPILKKLVALRIAMAKLSAPPSIVNLLRLGIASILIEVSNARHNHPSLSFPKLHKADAPVFDRFLRQVKLMVQDLDTFRRTRPEALILRGNSKRLEETLPARSAFDGVITSPPYPNRYSYARETRPQMFYLGLVDRAEQVGDLECEAIGGTWGKATSLLARRLCYRSPTVQKALRGIPERIGRQSTLMQNYIIKYFNDIEQHIQSLKPFLRPGARLAYVIGNSRFYGIDLPSEEILAAIFEANDFQTASVQRMRRRGSKAGLYEAIVLMKMR